MGLTLTTVPTEEPVSTAEAKLWAHIDEDDEDAAIASEIISERKAIEIEQRRALITQTWTWTADSFPAIADKHGVIYAPHPRLISVTSIQYVDTDGDTQTWASSKYDVDIASDPGRIAPAFGETYPSTRKELNAVTIVFVAGYGAASDVPETTKSAIKMRVAINLDRGSETRENKLEGMRMAADALAAVEALEQAG